VAMLAIALGFLAPNFTYVNDNYGLTASIGNFFGNVRGPSSLLVKLAPEALLSARAAHVLSAGMWGLAVVVSSGDYIRGGRGRPRGGRLLARSTPCAPRVRERGCASRLSLLLALDRMPCGLCPQSRTRDTLAAESSSSNRSACGSHRAVPGAFFGDDGVFVMTPADVYASEFAYTHVRPGPLMTLTDNFPAPIGGDFDRLLSVNSLLGAGYPGAKRLDPADVSLLTTEIASYGGGVTEPGYFAVSPSMIAYAEEYGLGHRGTMPHVCGRDGPSTRLAHRVQPPWCDDLRARPWP